ncbi:MAG: Gfo/Idh/MocA family oxidoreductase [Firmicutes bacterium]|nr:Gfo/Idh/MocA family oxidoreductase [Bacillota bacterium]MBR5488683.1 Gfo/Idh/MocA family oxidoreductase [Bacillota bacterium]
MRDENLRICIIGAGFVGMKHAAAYGASKRAKLQVACDSNFDAASRMAESCGFERIECNWEKAVTAEDVDIVCICVPNHMHFKIAYAALQAGKAVVSEKPLGMNSKESEELAALAEARMAKTSCCYNLVYVPAIQYVKRLIDRGELGELVCFRGCYDNDRLADPNGLFEWRMEKKHAEGGSICDLGLNIIAVSQYLFGDIVSVAAITDIIHGKRADRNGTLYDVENDDIAQFIYTYRNGGMGYISCNRVAPGSKQDMKFEIQFTKGAVRFCLERMNEIQVFRIGQSGYEIVKSDDSGWFNVGYEELKTIDAEHFLSCVSENGTVAVDFDFAAKVDKTIEAVLEAAERSAWVTIK